jgi:translation initiation factor IF-1
MNKYKIENSNNKDMQGYEFRIENSKSLIRKVLLLIAFIFFSIINLKATEQVSDLLIIKNDTFFLKTFPLEKLLIEKRIKKRPFKYNNDYGFPHTGCYRGYIATWKVIDDKLFLLKVEKEDDTNETLDLSDYFKSIGYTPNLIDGFVQADWYSDTLISYDFFMYYYNPKGFYLTDSYYSIAANDIQLIFEKGQLIENNIKRIDSYKKGDILWREIKYYRQWFLYLGIKKVKAVVLENNGNMVRVEIKDYGTKKKRVIKKLKREMKIIEGDKDWINPRYWNKE